MEYYLIGSLRNPEIPKIANKLRESGIAVFDDWYSAGPIADDSWKEYETGKGNTYQQALKGYAAKHVFAFDKHHLNRVGGCILALPAGKSGHLELGYMCGLGKETYILLDEDKKLPDDWLWLTGIYEGEGCLTRNGRKTNSHGMQLTVTMRDEDIIRRCLAVSGKGSIEGPYTRNNPKWSPMWRWTVRKRADVLYLLNGMWGLLGERRKEQARRVLTEARLTEELIHQSPGPQVFRWDIMYQFATGVFDNLPDLIKEINKPKIRVNILEGVKTVTPWYRYPIEYGTIKDV